MSPTLNIILQNTDSIETRAVHQATMLADRGQYQIYRSAADELDRRADLLAAGALPVGSVEFVRQAMMLAGIQEPPNLSYPCGCEPFLGRKISRTRAGSVLGRWFVKPVQTKRFTGFVFDSLQDPERLSEHDLEQYDAFMKMPADAQVFVCEPLAFRGEWRFYIDPVQAIPAIAWARYDQLPDKHLAMPDIKVVRKCIDAIALDHPYAADFGVTEDGETVLVEVNDFWALGLYKGIESITNKSYLDLLVARWESLLTERATQSASETPMP